MINEVELGKEYYLLDILPTIYNSMFYEAMNFVRDRDFISNKLGSLRIEVVKECIQESFCEFLDSVYNADEHKVYIYLPTIFIKQNIKSDKFIDLSVLQNYIYSNNILFGVVVHEVFHGTQNITEHDKLNVIPGDELRKERGEILHHEMTFEKDPVKANVLQFKKYGIGLDDIKNDMYYVFERRYVKEFGLYNKFVRINEINSFLKQNPKISSDQNNKMFQEINNYKISIKKLLDLKFNVDTNSIEDAMKLFRRYVKHRMEEDKSYINYINQFEKYWDNDKGVWKINKVIRNYCIRHLVFIAKGLDKIGMFRHADIVDDILLSLWKDAKHV